MTDKPILFPAPIARSLLHGAKSKARLFIKKYRRDNYINAARSPAPGDREAARREGWLLCQSAVLEMCEDAQREANEEWPESVQFSRGMKRAAKSISHDIRALSPNDSRTEKRPIPKV